jgi:hypothetical protein
MDTLELDRESAELLPDRQALSTWNYSCHYHPYHHPYYHPYYHPCYHYAPPPPPPPPPPPCG